MNIIWIFVLVFFIYIMSKRSFYNIIIPQSGNLYDKKIGTLSIPDLDRKISTQFYERI